jgi:hypothetical protein
MNMNTQTQTDIMPQIEFAAPLPDSQPLQLAVLPPEPEPALVLRAGAKSRSRTGKIARLPKAYRDMVNRLLWNNRPYSAVVEALLEHGIKVTQRNVSNWKSRGGYKEWRLEQDEAIQLRLAQDNLTEYRRTSDASALPEVGLQLAATQLSRFLLKPEAAAQLAGDPQAYSRVVATLCRLSHQIRALQKYRDDSAKELGPAQNPERLRRKVEEEVELTRKVYSSKIRDDFTPVPHRNYIPKDLDGAEMHE